jgi:hypothetical protein
MAALQNANPPGGVETSGSRASRLHERLPGFAIVCRAHLRGDPARGF